MSDLNFKTAVSRWRAWRDATAAAEADPANEPFDDAAFERAQEAETFLLEHPIQTVEEAAAVFELLIDCLADGGRCDGRDVEAMKRLRPFIAHADVKALRRSAA